MERSQMKDDNDNVVELFPQRFLLTEHDNPEEFGAAVRVANIVLPFLTRNSQMTSLGADLKIVYRDGEIEPRLLKQGAPLHYNRHELNIELRTFGGMVPLAPLGDLEALPLCLEHLNMFAEACMLRVLEEGSCLSILLWCESG